MPTTELSAVNICLGAIGEAPVNSISGQVTSDVSMALSIIREITSELQQEDWRFNSEDHFPLTPDTDKHINIPSNFLSISFPVGDFRDYIIRGTQLYNRADHTFEFDDAVYVNVKLLLTFDELPETARRYVTLKSTRIFQDRVLGASQLHDVQMRDELMARARLLNEDLRGAKLNIINGGSGCNRLTFLPAKILRGRRQ